ncbi:MAG: NADH-quinone oxidoreductase subunit L [Candidatus Eremiobacteraeota bacterium]|nr:NADH-quinone oxidoreductase subunit L [Candidatus Eremiobacteraeota bacterium]MBC5801468.1 NADH-quinone oxidoreductase subunit L [Candidatus Eremiobacteraeota bacterium]MBC5822867.1 NADH-quinone oxidoreductase subunit L [Candidatus Eremiobacteraeota bacterium]
MSGLLLAVWLLPFAGALAIWALGPQLRRGAGWIGSATVLLAFVLTLVQWGAATASGGAHRALVTWIPGFTLGLLLDPLSLLWSLIITGVGGLILVYSIGYMWSDRAIARFFAYMNFFVFAMLTLVLSDNLVGLLVGWGLVGLASYFLIGFWFDRPSAVEAARKAFVINVVGDVGIMFAVFALYKATGSITFAGIFSQRDALSGGLLFMICGALFVGCAAKSAQVPLQTWLPDAMEGPTPVSALIHAATMVTAGVYLIARFAPLWNASPPARELVGVVGAVTALLGAILGIAQWDIKRILAYSTMSQIGYMIMGVGIGAYQAGVLHFFTHAFFKAGLFLTAGLLIHELHDEQDVRKMGGLSRRMPFAFYAMLAGTLAIIGFPGFSGYFSKDAVVYAMLEHGQPALYAVGALTAAITAYYMFRMLFLTFFGPYRGELEDAELGILPDRRAHRDEHMPPVHPAELTRPAVPVHGHAPAWLMNLPVAILALFAVIAGYVAIGGATSPWWRFFGGLFGAAPAVAASTVAFSESLSTLLVSALVAIGIIVAFVRYGSPAAQLASVERIRAESLGRPAIFAHAFYFDDAIDALVVRPARSVGTFIARFVDPHVLDGGVRDVAWGAGALGVIFRALQTGLVRSYALTILVGTACFIAYFALIGSAR